MNELIEYIFKKHNQYVKDAIKTSSIEKLKLAAETRIELKGIEITLTCIIEEMEQRQGIFKDIEIEVYIYELQTYKDRIHKFLNDLYE